MVGGTISAPHHTEHGALHHAPVGKLATSLRRRHAAAHSGRKWQMVLLVAGLVGVVAGLVALSGQSSSELNATDLVKQIEHSSEGVAPSRHVFGGLLTVERSNNQVAVTAQDIPPKVCVLAAWELARKGLVVINGVTPNRISAAKLSELCNDQDTAKLTWVVKPQG